MTAKPRKRMGKSARIDGVYVEDDKPLELENLPPAKHQFTSKGRKMPSIREILGEEKK